MSDNTGLIVVVGIVAVLLLIAAVLLVGGVYAIYRYRIPVRGIAAMIGSFIYLLSPVDAAPEAVLGPLGLVDDAGLLTIVAWYVYHLVRARRTNLPMRRAAGIALRETARDGLPRARGTIRRQDRD